MRKGDEPVSTIINVDFARASRSKVARIAPAVEQYERPLAEDHSSDPIKNIATIRRISSWLIANRKWRDNMLFIVGINFGLRVSDLLTLRFADLLDDEGRFRESFAILEKKTAKTRNVARNRYIAINDAVMDAVLLYLDHTPGVTLSDYLFRSEGNRGKNTNQPLHRSTVDRIMRKWQEELGLSEHLATHSLRKTFGYHQMMQGGNSERTLLLLQKMFGHSSATQTMQYIGLTAEEMVAAYKSLNLGGEDYSIVKTTIREETVPA